MAAQTGYKTSELGDIPQDWDVVELGDILKIKHGKNQKEVESPNGTYPILATGGQIGWATEYLYDKPSVLIGRKGTIDKPRYQDTPFWTVDTLFYSEIGTSRSAKFIFYKFCLIDWIKNNEASGVPSQNAKTIEKIKISLPPLPEQTAIATALSDTDALIGSLKTLIAKKKAIKLSAMQNLLGGKIRLPAFAQRPDGSPKTTRQTELGLLPEDWEVGTIGKDCVLKARIGWQSLRTDEYLESGEYGLITGTDLNNGLVDWKTCAFVSEWRYKQDTNIQLKVNDVLITKDGTIGKIGYINELPFSATLNSGIYVVRPKNSNLIESMFLFFLFSSEYFNDFISVISAGSTITHLYQKDFFNFQFPLPSKPEQTAIAQLLSDIDAEIEALECRLKKTQSLKQGMMQALLSGKIRLPLK